MEKYALLVGINKYQLPGNDLNGCVNDVQDMYQLLTEQYGFNPDNVRVLVDERATHAEEMHRLEWLVAQAKSGDVAVWYHSGHGAQLRDRSGDELSDGLDEVLIPHDLDANWLNVITDDEIGLILREMEDGVNMTCMIDTCLSGDTEISLLDGTIKTIKEMVGGGDFWVYSAKADGTVVPGHAHSARITGKRELVRVVLDNGAEVECTDDHLFMLRDGSYKKAGDLSLGESLMPLYRKVGTEDQGYLDGYELIHQTTPKGKRRWLPTHLMVRDYFSLKGSDEKRVCHHKNYNKRDNRPENLEMMTWAEHKKAHGEVGRRNMQELWSSGDFREWRSSAEYKQKQSALIKSCWKDPLYRDSHVKGAQGRDNSKNAQRFLVQNKDPKFIKQTHTVDLNAKRSAAMKRQWAVNGAKMYAAIQEAQHTRWHVNRGVVSDNCPLCTVGNNHKVVKVERTGKVELVYDLTVDDYHNFAVTAGVFVHNCHSGTVSRNFKKANNTDKDYRKARFIVPPFDLQARSLGRRLNVRRFGEKDVPSAALVNTGIKTIGQNHVLLSGCQDHQTSDEAYIGDSVRGALTYYVTKALRETQGISWYDLHTHVCSELRGKGFTQQPNLTGDVDNLKGTVLLGKQ